MIRNIVQKQTRVRKILSGTGGRESFEELLRRIETNEEENRVADGK